MIVWSMILLCCSENKVDSVLLSPEEELGHYLFFEKRLSINQTKSCASCHSPEFAFTDGYRRSVTPLGESVTHNAPTLINACFYHFFDWANLKATTLETQIKRPLYAEHPIELGLQFQHLEVANFMRHDSLYIHLFKKAFAHADTLYTLDQIEKAIVAYEKKLVSFNSPYDLGTMSLAAQRGFKLFNGKVLQCATCHKPPAFTLSSYSTNPDSLFANIGLYNCNSRHEYPMNDAGLINHTGLARDNGKFKIPTLRNVALTAPYMHDGSISSIEEVIDIYARGGQLITYGPNKGDGALNKYKHPLLNGFEISTSEKKDLIEFLFALSDTSIVVNTLFLNPFTRTQ